MKEKKNNSLLKWILIVILVVCLVPKILVAGIGLILAFLSVGFWLLVIWVIWKLLE